MLFDDHGRLKRKYANMIRKAARSMVGRHGFTADDVDDLRQDIIIGLLEREGWGGRDRYTDDRFIALAIRQVIGRIIRHANADKRKVHTETRSLDEEFDNGDDNPISRHECLSEESHLAARRDQVRTAQEQADLWISLELAITKLPWELRYIAGYLTSHTPAETARILGVPPSTLREKMKLIRQALARGNFGEC